MQIYQIVINELVNLARKGEDLCVYRLVETNYMANKLKELFEVEGLTCRCVFLSNSKLISVIVEATPEVLNESKQQLLLKK